MPVNLDTCKKLFQGYLLTEEAPLRINLPRDLLIILMRSFCFLRELPPEEKEAFYELIDLDWYADLAYQDQAFSESALTKEKESFELEYEQWRSSLQEEKYTTPAQVYSSLRQILGEAAFSRTPVTIGENHTEVTPKVSLMENASLLREQRALVFIEGLRKELQAEFDKSVLQQSLTPLAELYLNFPYLYPDSPPQYAFNKLAKFFIERGIPVVGCETSTTATMGLVPTKDNYDINRLKQGYEHFKSRQYARQHFPRHDWHLSLIGDLHAFTFRHKNALYTENYPSVVDFMGGVYLRAEDRSSAQAKAPYLKLCPVAEEKAVFPNYEGRAKPGYLLRAGHPSEISVYEESPSFGLKLASGLAKFGSFAPLLEREELRSQKGPELFAEESLMPQKSLRFKL